MGKNKPLVRVLWIKWGGLIDAPVWEPYVGTFRIDSMPRDDPDNPSTMLENIILRFITRPSAPWDRKDFRILSYPEKPACKKDEKVKTPNWWGK